MVLKAVVFPTALPLLLLLAALLLLPPLLLLSIALLLHTASHIDYPRFDHLSDSEDESNHIDFSKLFPDFEILQCNDFEKEDWL